MQSIPVLASAVTHQLYRAALDVSDRVWPRPDADEPRTERDRGAVSLEQVLWFVAAGVSVAVIAGILWSQIRSQASSPISTPSAP